MANFFKLFTVSGMKNDVFLVLKGESCRNTVILKYVKFVTAKTPLYFYIFFKKISKLT